MLCSFFRIAKRWICFLCWTLNKLLERDKKNDSVACTQKTWHVDIYKNFFFIFMCSIFLFFNFFLSCSVHEKSVTKGQCNLKRTVRFFFTQFFHAFPAIEHTYRLCKYKVTEKRRDFFLRKEQRMKRIKMPSRKIKLKEEKIVDRVGFSRRQKTRLAKEKKKRNLNQNRNPNKLYKWWTEKRRLFCAVRANLRQTTNCCVSAFHKSKGGAIKTIYSLTIYVCMSRACRSFTTRFSQPQKC